MLAFAALALALGFPGQTDGPKSCVLYVRTADEWAPLRSGPVDREIVPLHSRTDRVPCASITPQGIGFRIWAGDVPIEALDQIEVVAVQHGLEERVLAVAMKARVPADRARDEPRHLRIVGAPTLPSGAFHEARLPLLARQDGAFSHDATLDRIGRPKVAALKDHLLFGLDGDVVEMRYGALTPWSGRSSARIHSADSHGTATLRSPVDQVFFATAREVDPKEQAPLRLRSASVGSAALGDWAPWRGTGPVWPRLNEPREERADVRAALAERDDLRVSTEAGALVDIWIEPPPSAPEGRTWTLLVTLHGTSAWPPPTDAPRARPQSRFGMFIDIAYELGLEMVHLEGPDLQLDIRPTMGPGIALGDVDGDGWVDLFLPQGGGREGSAMPTSRFFRNDAGRRFHEESAQRGLALTGAGMGALFYDADGDGDLDLFVANYGECRFLVNDGQGKFTDASAAVGLDSDMWHAAVSADDFDRDGDLDLYVSSYLRYDLAQMASGEELGRYQREDPVEMLPFAFPGERKLFLRCDPAHVGLAAAGGTAPPFRYVDAAKELILDDVNGRGMQAIWWDFDQDGDRDLYLANDVSPNRFWRNEGDGKFRDVGFSTGLDDPRGCMGLAVGDVDGDLDEDLFVTNWQLESNALYVNNLKHTSSKSRVSTFRDRAVDAGLGQLSVGTTGWGCELADFDLDGDLDLFYANGYTSPDYETTGICVGQPCHYFENDGAGQFTAAFKKAGPDVAVPLASRAAVACDYDQDGDLDLVVTANNGRLRLLRNDAPREKRHWLGVRLEGTGGNTRAIGARVVLEAGGKKLLRSLRAGTGYLSGNAPELHFGLGEATKVDACTVTWPSGKTSTHAIEGVDRFVTIAEPQ